MENNKENKKINMKYNFSIYWKFLMKYKYIFLFILFTIFLTESAQISQNFIFKWIIDSGTSFASGILAKNIFIHIFTLSISLLIAIVLLRAIAKWLFIHFLNRLEVDLIRDIKTKFFNHIVSLSHSFHTTHKTGSMISRLTRSGGAVERMSDVLLFNFSPLLFQ